MRVLTTGSSIWQVIIMLCNYYDDDAGYYYYYLPEGVKGSQVEGREEQKQQELSQRKNENGKYMQNMYSKTYAKALRPKRWRPF